MLKLHEWTNFLSLVESLQSLFKSFPSVPHQNCWLKSNFKLFVYKKIIKIFRYLIEIAKCANIDFKPDPRVMREDDDEITAAERNLINFMNEVV